MNILLMQCVKPFWCRIFRTDNDIWRFLNLLYISRYFFFSFKNGKHELVSLTHVRYSYLWVLTKVIYQCSLKIILIYWHNLRLLIYAVWWTSTLWWWNYVASILNMGEGCSSCLCFSCLIIIYWRLQTSVLIYRQIATLWSPHTIAWTTPWCHFTLPPPCQLQLRMVWLCFQLSAFFKPCTGFHLDSRMNWLDFCGKTFLATFQVT